MRITIAPYDSLNPMHGYELKVENNSGQEVVSYTTSKYLTQYESEHIYYLIGMLQNFLEGYYEEPND